MEKQIEFKAEKETLRGKLFIPKGKGPFPGVVTFHGSGGIGSKYFEAARKYSNNGIVGLAFNYRGAGESDGKFEDQSVGNGLEDARAALKYLVSLPEVDENRIGLCGGSFGGFNAALISGSYDIKSLVLIGPAAYSKNVYSLQRNGTFSGAHNKDYLSSESFAELKKYKGPLLMINSEFEEVIPPEVIQEYLKSAKNVSKLEEYMLKGAKHRFSIHQPAVKNFLDKTTDWFLETL